MRSDDITRRGLLCAGLCAGVLRGSDHPVEVPVLRILNKHAACSAAQVRQFCATVWDEAVRTFQSCGIAIRTVERPGEVLTYPSGRPRFLGLEKTMLNVVLTDRIPLYWDSGRSLAGLSTVYEGHHLTVIALEHAYPNRVPIVATNTVVHELLHVFRGDIFVPRNGLFRGTEREAAVDWHATRLWLLDHGPGVKESARRYVEIVTNPRPRR